MVLSEERQDWLNARYNQWGLDAVRLEVERNLRDDFSPPDVVAFAREWVAAEETKSKRTNRFFKILGVVVISLIGGTIASISIF